MTLTTVEYTFPDGSVETYEYATLDNSQAVAAEYFEDGTPVTEPEDN